MDEEEGLELINLEGMPGPELIDLVCRQEVELWNQRAMIERLQAEVRDLSFALDSRWFADGV